MGDFGSPEIGPVISECHQVRAAADADGDEVVINGRKWWSTGVGQPDCKILVFMGRRTPPGADPEADRHSCHAMALVPLGEHGHAAVRRWAIRRLRAVSDVDQRTGAATRRRSRRGDGGVVARLEISKHQP